jgi:hypothetical protein
MLYAVDSAVVNHGGYQFPPHTHKGMDVFALAEPIHVVITVYQRYAAMNSLANAIILEKI